MTAREVGRSSPVSLSLHYINEPDDVDSDLELEDLSSGFYGIKESVKNFEVQVERNELAIESTNSKIESLRQEFNKLKSSFESYFVTNPKPRTSLRDRQPVQIHDTDDADLDISDCESKSEASNNDDDTQTSRMEDSPQSQRRNRFRRNHTLQDNLDVSDCDEKNELSDDEDVLSSQTPQSSLTPRKSRSGRNHSHEVTTTRERLRKNKPESLVAPKKNVKLHEDNHEIEESEDSGNVSIIESIKRGVFRFGIPVIIMTTIDKTKWKIKSMLGLNHVCLFWKPGNRVKIEKNTSFLTSWTHTHRITYLYNGSSTVANIIKD